MWHTLENSLWKRPWIWSKIDYEIMIMDANIASGTHCLVDWVSPRSGLYGCGKSRPHRDSIPAPSRPGWVSVPTELSRPTVCMRTTWNSIHKTKNEWNIRAVACKTVPVHMSVHHVQWKIHSHVITGKIYQKRVFTTEVMAFLFLAHFHKMN